MFVFIDRKYVYMEHSRMEQRKIISLGRSSLVVSLPKHWIEMNKLKQGDVVSVAVQRDRSLVIFPGTRSEELKKITLYVDPDENPAAIARKVIACYLNGYFGIRLTSKKIFTVPQQRAIRDISRKLYMRIMESDAKSVYIQTLIDETKASVETAVRRMHAIAVSMYRDALNSLRNQDVELARIVCSLDNDVDHFSFFILRLIRSVILNPELTNYLGIEAIDCPDYQTLVHRIEQVADRAANIARCIILLSAAKQRIPSQILDLILKVGETVSDAYDRAIKAFFSRDVDEANKIIELRHTIESLDQDVATRFFMRKTRNAALSCAICSIRDNIRETMEHVVDIADITVDRFYMER
ncbi:phosphate uptake regulator PhoU [Candidatus Bathyarchaeota archaeon]|nr:MAG: phosphate uptake regulator PhoU [Candidatus Bathyarchaeota archaeon]